MLQNKKIDGYDPSKKNLLEIIFRILILKNISKVKFLIVGQKNWIFFSYKKFCYMFLRMKFFYLQKKKKKVNFSSLV